MLSVHVHKLDNVHIYMYMYMHVAIPAYMYMDMYINVECLKVVMSQMRILGHSKAITVVSKHALAYMHSGLIFCTLEILS